MQPQRILPRLLLPPNRPLHLLIMLIDIIDRVGRVGEVLRRLEEAADEGFDEAADGGGDGGEAGALGVGRGGVSGLGIGGRDVVGRGERGEGEEGREGGEGKRRRGREREESAYNRSSNFTQRALDFLAGGVAVGARGAEDGTWCRDKRMSIYISNTYGCFEYLQRGEGGYRCHLSFLPAGRLRRVLSRRAGCGVLLLFRILRRPC